jgi:hypothetical protein
VIGFPEAAAHDGPQRVNERPWPMAPGVWRRQSGFGSLIGRFPAKSGHQRPGHPDTGHSTLRDVVSDCLHDTGRKIEPLLHQICGR